MPRKVISIPKGPVKTPVATKRTLGEDTPHPLSGLHVNGVPVDALPAARLVGLFWAQTDEGIAASNAGKSKVKVAVVGGELDNALRHKRDFGLNETEPWLAPDPMWALAEQYVGPGMHPRFLSEARLGKEGNYTRGFQVVRKENGDPVKLGTLVLAEMPEEVAERGRRHYEDKGNAAVKQVYAQAREQSEGLVRTARELGMDTTGGADERYFEGAEA